jgi:hypothetical protein
VRVLVAGAAVAAVAPTLWSGAAAEGSGEAGGAQVWVAREAGPGNAEDSSAGIAVSPDGSTVYVATRSAADIVVVARDAATGAQRWAVRTPASGDEQLFAHAIALSPDGSRLFVTAEVEPDVDTREMLTVAYDTATHAELWSARLSAGAGRMAIPSRLAVGPDGARLFVTGSVTGSGGGDVWNYVTAGYSAATGKELWKATYDGPAGRGDTAEGLAVAPNGRRVFVTGTSASSGSGRDIATVAYAAANGSRKWVARYDEGEDNWAADLVVSPNGTRVYAAGYGRPSLGVPHGFRLAAYDAKTGAGAGVARFDDEGDDFAADAAIAGDGSRVFVTGTGGSDFLTVAFDAPSLGPPRWARRYDGGHGIDNAYAIAVAGTSVYVTGESEQGRGACFGEVRSTAFATVQLAADDGAQAWATRYAGRNKYPDQPRDVVVSPDGSLVFVTGNSDSICRRSDVATVAYEP